MFSGSSRLHPFPHRKNDLNRFTGFNFSRASLGSIGALATLHSAGAYEFVKKQLPH